MSSSPRKLGKYELQQRLGWGGMAEAWKAFDVQLQRYVAIELLHTNLQADPGFVARFQREAQLIASLHHANIVQIHAYQVAAPPEMDSPIAYMVMDYIEGPTLAEYIHTTSARGAIPSPIDILNFFTSINLAIDYAHQQGMIHCDIKPANILLDTHNTRFNSVGEPILTDFGLAKLLGMSTSAISGTQLGTPLYISPEQAQGLPGDARSDLYSLGVILYELVTGVTPFRGDTPVAVIMQHAKSTHPSPSQFNPRIPPALADVILRCLAKDPNARFPNAVAMTIALAHSLNLPVPERLGAPTNRLHPAEASMFFNPLSPDQESSGRIAAVNTSGPTLAASSQNLPIVALAQPYPAATSGAQLPSSQTGPQYAASAAFAQSAANYPTQLAAQSPLAPSLPHPPRLAPRPQVGRWYIAFAALLLVVMIGTGLGAFLLLVHPFSPPPTTVVVDRAFYVSSGQIVTSGKTAEDARGIADRLQIDMQNVQRAPQGKSYYLWLLGDKPPTTTLMTDSLVPAPIQPPILLNNNLPVQSDGTVHWLYKGDAQNNNLLSATSRLLITLEAAGRTPTSPSPDRSTWKYYAELPQAIIPMDFNKLILRGLDHIRHIFYNEDHLQVDALYGGLDIWVFNNTGKLMEWSTAARDDFDPTNPGAKYGQMHDLFTNILDYLDGRPNVYLDVPLGTDVTADAHIARIGLLHNPKGNPPGDLEHLRLHVNELNMAPDASQEIHQRAQEIRVAINNALEWLTCAQAEARQLLYMTLNLTPPSMATCQVAESRAACAPRQPAQDVDVCVLPQSMPVCTNQQAQDFSCLLNDLVRKITYAYIGQLDPSLNTITPGVLQAHNAAQQLAVFDITSRVPASL